MPSHGGVVRLCPTMDDIQLHRNPQPEPAASLVSSGGYGEFETAWRSGRDLNPRENPCLEVTGFGHLPSGASAAACGTEIGEMPIPDGSAVIMLIGVTSLLRSMISIVLARDDHVYVVYRQEDESLVRLLFGQTY